jgi:hypothetical protein
VVEVGSPDLGRLAALTATRGDCDLLPEPIRLSLALEFAELLNLKSHDSRLLLVVLYLLFSGNDFVTMKALHRY